ncbi:hypothetical protein K438DRAFT_1974006 [Mycena galopus ATCC 62051]|nr:hypothetical protein K438DRAFT_1974006 [Mycena galopus ATCC 62051]
MDSDTFTAATTIGALQTGVLVSYVLFGITTCQAHIYYGRFPEDSLRLKYLVAYVWYATPHFVQDTWKLNLWRLCELAFTISVGHALYTYTITDYGQLAKSVVQTMPLSIGSTGFFSGIIVAPVQVFFAHRAYALSRKPLIPCALWALAFLVFLGSMALAGIALRGATLRNYGGQWGWLAITTWSLSVMTDIGITVVLVFLLYRQRNEGLFIRRTTALIDQLIKWTVGSLRWFNLHLVFLTVPAETGMLTSLFSTLNLVCFVVMGDNCLYRASIVSN